MRQLFRHGIPKSIVLPGAILGLFLLACAYLGNMLLDPASANGWWTGSGLAYGLLAFAVLALSLVLLAALPRQEVEHSDADPGSSFSVFTLGWSLITGFTLMLLVSRLFPAFQAGRYSFGMPLFFAFAGIVLVHLVSGIKSALFSPWRVLVLGAGSRAFQLQTWVAENDPGSELLAYVDWGNRRVVDPSFNVLADDKSIIDLVARYDIDEIVVALDKETGGATVEVLLDCKMRGISVIDASEFCRSRRHRNKSVLAAVAQAAHLFRWG